MSKAIIREHSMRSKAIRSKALRSITIFLITMSILCASMGGKTVLQVRADETADYGLNNPTKINGVMTWDCIYFGNYYQNDETGSTKDPIKWRVLAVDGDDVFLLADQNLDTGQYYNTTVSVTWENSDMRTWLNGEFYDAAFTESEKAVIQTTQVVNNDNSEYGTSGGENTEDKVFLLSTEEAKNPAYGFSSTVAADETRVACNTAYRIARGSQSTIAEDWWWLRSPGNVKYSAAHVNGFGQLFSQGRDVKGNGAVRPALHLNLSSNNPLTAAWDYAGWVDETGNEGRVMVSYTEDDADKVEFFDNFAAAVSKARSKATDTNQAAVRVLSNTSVLVNVSITENVTLEVVRGQTLTVNSGVELTNSGAITNSGTITNNGTITNSGAITNSGTITNSGVVTNSGVITNNGTITNNNTITNNGTITNKGEFDGEGILSGKGFSMEDEVSAEGVSVTYNGESHSIKVTAPTGAVVTYSDSQNGTYRAALTYKNAGTYTVYYKVEKIGYDTISKSAVLKIAPKSLSDSMLTLSATTLYYTGKEQKPTVAIRDGNTILNEGTDYSITYSNHINIGTAKVTVQAKGNYSGTIETTYAITVKKGASYTVSGMKYKITNANTSGKGCVSVTGATKKTLNAVTIKDSVSIGGKTFKVTEVSDKAFKGYKKLTKVTIGKNVTKIGKEAFTNSKKLKAITIKGTKLKSVGKNALKGIHSKATIKVPKSKLKSYKKLFKSSTGFKKTMKVK